MYVDSIVWFKYKILTSSCLIFLLVRFILIVDSAKPGNPSTSRQMCLKLQSMLSYGKYQTSQISSNITYKSRIYAQNFLAYSSIDDLLLFIEPKHQINVYNARTIHLIVNISTTDVVIATSTTSLIVDSRHDLFFIYETNSKTNSEINLISLRVCQVRFNIFNLNFENNYCIDTITLQYDQTDLRINGFTIKRDHIGTKKSLLFISTDIGIIYSIFDTYTGSLIGESKIMNETLNEGSIVLSSSGSIYYASKQEHLIYELQISRDFRLRYGKIIKTNAIKYPFGLITDECKHLYIATRSMILVMFEQTFSTIRSVFSKASDLPITLERVNSTTYVYATIRKNSGKTVSHWMFNFLYFTDPERANLASKYPAVLGDEKLDFTNTTVDNDTILILWPVSYPLKSTANTTKKYIQFSSTSRKPSSRFIKKISKQTRPTISTDRDMSSIDENKLFTLTPSTKNSIPDLSEDPQFVNPNDNLEIDNNVQFEFQEQINPPLDNEVQSETHLEQNKSSNSYSFPPNSTKSIIPVDDPQNDLSGRENLILNATSRYTTSLIEQSSDSYLISKQLNSTLTPPLNRTVDIAGTIYSEDDIQSYLEGRGNLSSKQEAQIQAYLAKQSSSDYNIFAKYLKTTSKPSGIVISDDDLSSEFRRDKNTSMKEDMQSQDYAAKRPPFDSKFLNRTIDTEEIIFSDEEVESYLQDRTNLSAIQEVQIQAYLSKQISSNHSLFSKYLMTTKKPTEIFISDNNISSFLQTQDNTSSSTDTKSEDSPFKLPPFDSKSPNRTIDIAGTIFSEEDVQSYLEGRGNLSSSQEAQIQAYLAKQSSVGYELFSKFFKTTKRPTQILTSDGHVLSESQERNNFSLSHDSQSQSYVTEDTSSVSDSVNRTIDITEASFSEDDVQSYLEGKENLTLSQKIQIQIYLAKQSSSNYTIFSRYSKSTKPTTGIYVTDDNMKLKPQDDKYSFSNYSTKQPLSDSDLHSEYFEHITDFNETLISNDDLKSYLEGRLNLSTIQKTQIQTYLARQSSSYYNIFSKYSKSTTKPSGIVLPDEKPQSDSSSNDTSLFNEESQFQNYLKQLNRTADTDGIIFSDDDLKSYLQGRGNLSKSQEAQIQAYLARQSSLPYNLFSKYSTSTKKPRRTLIPGRNIQPDSRKDGNMSLIEDIPSEDYSEELLPFDPTYYNRTMDSKEMLFSDDDLQAYLEDRANLSKNQEAQIQAYLARQSSLPYNLFSKYSTSTKKPRRTLIPGRNIQPDSRRDGNMSLIEDIPSEDYSEELLPFDPTYYNRTTDSKEILFSDDDLKSYLQDRGNLSKSQEAQIQAYLARQSSLPYNLFSKYSTSTRKPRRTLIPGRNIQPDSRRDGNMSLIEDIQSGDYSEELLPFDPTYYNRTTDSKEILFSDDDLKSYLQDRANLSKSQEAQIQAYLARQSSLPYNLFSKYSTSTRKPRRTLIPGRNIQPDSRRDGNMSLIEDIQSGDYSEELLPFDPADYNRTADSKEMLFSDDDLQAYLDDRANLSKSQEAEIQAYLIKQASSNHSIFSKYSKSTKLPTRIYTSDDNLHPDYQNGDTQSQNYLTKTPVFNSKYFNFSTDSEEILFSEDDLQSYLQGRGNLSLAQEAQIKAYLAKQTSLDNNTFSRYLTSTRKPTKTLTYDDKLQLYPEGQTNLSLSKQLQSSESASQKFTSTIPYTTGKRTGGIRPSESVVNGSSEFDDSIEQHSDIYTDSNDDNNISIDMLDNYSQLSTSTTINTSLEDVQVTISSDVTKSEIDDPINRRSTVSSFDQLTQDISNTNLTLSTLSLNDLSIIEDHSLVTQFKPTVIDDSVTVHLDDYDQQKAVEDDDDKVNPPLLPTKLKSTTDPNFSHSSSLSVDIDISSTPHSSSPLTLSSTTLLPSRRSRLSSPLHRSLSSSSTKSPKFTRFSSSKLFSEITKTTPLLSSEVTMLDSRPTTMLSYSTLFPSSTSTLQSSHKFSTMQTTDTAITSNIPKQKSITTPSSPFTTHHPRFKLTSSSTPSLTTDEQILTTKSDQYTYTSPKIHMETSSLPYVSSTRLFTTLVPGTNLDSSSTIMSDKTSSRSSIITTDEENLALSDNRPLETTEILSQLSDKYQEGLITTQSSLELASTMFPHFYKSKTSSTPEYATFDRIHPSPESTLPFMRRTSYPSTTSTITTTTERRYRTRKQKITRWQTQQLSTTTTSSSTTTIIIPSYQTTSIHDHKSTTSTQISIWHSEWNPLEQQEKIVIKPPLTTNSSDTRLTNDLLNQIFNNITTSTNSSSEKLIYFNLIDLPPSSWNLSLNSNESINLDVTLPLPVYPSYFNTTTNLTFTNIQANRFSTNINGMPVNLQFDRVNTKKFSLIMNATDNSMNRNGTIQHLSDIIIGHVKSEQFELNLTKSDNMHVHVKQVDSATAELYLDSNFCTNESSLEINLNLSKNGTIRYGNRTPIHIGPVFTRVHMLKQSCDREQPLTLFFDICERQNPCSNGGTCLSILPDYNDISYIPTDTGHIGYKCHCPLHISGEHCQDLQYPLGYCLNDGTLFQINDRYNKSMEKCICPIGFHGDHCEENIDNCIGIGCSDHGICEDGIETYKCSCYDGFYGFNCERTNVQTVLLQAASRSFGVVAILLIVGIAGLVVASDIHTYLTRKQQKNSLLNKIPPTTSELFENSVLLLGFSDAPIEMNDLSKVGTNKKPVTLKQRQTKRTTRNRRPVGYRQLSRRRLLTTFPKSSSRRYLVSSQSRQTIL